MSPAVELAAVTFHRLKSLFHALQGFVNVIRLPLLNSFTASAHILLFIMTPRPFQFVKCIVCDTVKPFKNLAPGHSFHMTCTGNQHEINIKLCVSNV